MYNIFVLEDEIIVSMEIQGRLQNLGYNVCGSASSGEKALEALETLEPDLALLDIRIKGDLTGIDVANELRKQHNIPCLFLTSHSDRSTLDKAKLAYPFGYLLKPVDEYSLHTNIEVTMFRHQMEKKLRIRENWLETTLRSIGDGVITTDADGNITFLNPAAEKLTGWKSKDALDKFISKVFDLQVDNENPALRAIKEKREIYTLDSKSTNQTGDVVYFQAHSTPIIDDNDGVIGAVVIFRNIISTNSN